ncbi:DUF6326 family protein [Polaribacter litorisediminis]|uniref:DUF6326 family protein n=1 Tax=Polaribacter litorisediminis TaxID=1908341 RepID=UPI001CBB8407|nr:DUF6326 family protein [Polaribacter litorisediminis]UAM99045.1 DUF6326 family protein [Polaribacter litorisediminis]
MSIKTNSSKSLTNYNINIKIKLAALWSTLMFLYIYADFFQLMTPKKLEKMIDLQTPMGPTSPVILVVFSVILIIPSLMIFLSVFLKPQINKWLNICIAALYASMSILIIVSTLGSEWHTFYILFNLIEVFVFAMIIYQAWKWPRD